MDNANDIAHTIDPRKRIVISAILLISDFICLMSQTMMVTALPVIQSDMHQAMTTVQWLTIGYTLLIGIVTPLAANLYEKFTNRQVFLGTIGIFTFGTVLGCVAQSFWMLLLADPMLKVSIFKVQSFRLMTLIGIAAFMVLLGTEQMVSIFAQDMTHLTSMQAGMVLLPGAALNAITTAIVGRLYDEFGPKQLVLGGTVLMLFGTFPFVMIKATMPVWLMTTAYAVRMVGNALVFSPVMSEAFKDLTPLEVSHATALNNALRQVFGSVSVTLLIVISEIPHSFVIGMRCSMWITLILTVLVLILFIRYLNVKRRG